MALKNSKENWGALAKFFHWTIAALIIAMIILGLSFDYIPRGLERLELFNLHKATGILILGLMSLRLLWRLMNPTPILPPTLSGFERFAAMATHWLLYLTAFAMPISGYIFTSARNVPFTFFGLFPVPLLVGPDKPLSHQMHDLHENTAWVLIALVSLHILAALRHHFLLHDEILKKMLPGGGKSSS